LSRRACQVAERRVAVAPGPLLTELLLRAGLGSGRLPTPTVGRGAIEVPLPFRPGCRLTLRPDGDGSLVTLEGPPPPWPWSVRWAERTLQRLLGRP
jgi:hypothetical protein